MESGRRGNRHHAGDQNVGQYQADHNIVAGQFAVLALPAPLEQGVPVNEGHVDTHRRAQRRHYGSHPCRVGRQSPRDKTQHNSAPVNLATGRCADHHPGKRQHNHGSKQFDRGFKNFYRAPSGTVVPCRKRAYRPHQYCQRKQVKLAANTRLLLQAEPGAHGNDLLEHAGTERIVRETPNDAGSQRRHRPQPGQGGADKVAHCLVGAPPGTQGLVR